MLAISNVYVFSLYSESNSKYISLTSSYNQLKSSYNSLKSDYDLLKNDYNSLRSYYRVLSQNVSDLYQLLLSYIYIPEAFPRVFNKYEVEKVSSTVWSITGGSMDSWSSYEKIYNYITSKIMYVKDIEMPYIDYWYITIDNFEYVTRFKIYTFEDYKQTPGFTLELKQGDCDDQAILAYAMIQYYRKYVLGTLYKLYLAKISFSDDSGHLAVFLPVKGGQLCIIDPAGKYLTSTRAEGIASKPAYSELQAYYNYWLEDDKAITHIILYDVSIEDGSYSVAVEGTLNQIITFLSQT